MNIDTDKICTPPEVCGEDADISKQEHLIAQLTEDDDSRINKFLKRDKPLLISIGVLTVLMNLHKLSYVLYPFKIFSTWIHEMSHGVAAILCGGGIQKLLIYPDTSGLAYTYITDSNFKRGFVASGGYTGTAVLGMVMLLFRRTHRGPTIGTISLGVLIILSCALYVRNTFALVMLPIMAIVLIICAWKLRAREVGYLYSFLAATCSFNAVDNISELFKGEGYVNGQPTEGDAHTVAEYWGGHHIVWAAYWFIFAFVCSGVGLLFAFDGIVYKQHQKHQKLEEKEKQLSTPVIDSSDLVV